MDQILFGVFSFLIGLVLGTLFFGGLWFTVKKAVTSKIPALWIFSSFLFRIGITLVGFYYVSLGNWQRLLICVVGFVAGRIITLRFTKLMEEKKIRLKKEATHEA
jgi:F1F0 ATPase subunit 2